MKSSGISFHHPWAFWLGCALITAGVFGHAPMFLVGQHAHWQMVGMPMTGMWLGMAAIPLGLVLSVALRMANSAVMLWRAGVETRGLRLEAIQQAIAGR